MPLSPDLVSALVVFAFVTSGTPGPNNLMLMASGANFGFRRTVPHMLGVTLGFGAMVFIVGLGLAGLFHTSPLAVTVLKVVSVAYMLWLAWKIAHATAPKDGEVVGRPLNFVQAALFQWVNPKGWAIALTATSIYAADGRLAAVVLVALVFTLVSLPSVGVWAWFGQGVRRFLSTGARLRMFNLTMAVLLVLSLWPVLKL